jgi:hypothetical protein
LWCARLRHRDKNPSISIKGGALPLNFKWI